MDAHDEAALTNFAEHVATCANQHSYTPGSFQEWVAAQPDGADGLRLTRRARQADISAVGLTAYLCEPSTSPVGQRLLGAEVRRSPLFSEFISEVTDDDAAATTTAAAAATPSVTFVDDLMSAPVRGEDKLTEQALQPAAAAAAETETAPAASTSTARAAKAVPASAAEPAETETAPAASTSTARAAKTVPASEAKPADAAVAVSTSATDVEKTASPASAAKTAPAAADSAPRLHSFAELVREHQQHASDEERAHPANARAGAPMLTQMSGTLQEDYEPVMRAFASLGHRDLSAASAVLYALAAEHDPAHLLHVTAMSSGVSLHRHVAAALQQALHHMAGVCELHSYE